MKLDADAALRDDLALFPRLQRRGPIEAIQNQAVADSVRTFPRLQRRGPIEAGRRRGTRRAWTAGFRAFNGAAPLKLQATNNTESADGVSAPSTARPH